MQENNETPSDFLRRTDTLAARLRCNLDDLPEYLGISRASLYGYRKGHRAISGKSWRLLEAAEQAAGIEESKRVNVSHETLKKGLPEAGNAESCGNPKESEMGAEKIPELLRRIADALEEIARKLPPLE